MLPVKNIFIFLVNCFLLFRLKATSTRKQLPLLHSDVKGSVCSDVHKVQRGHTFCAVCESSNSQFPLRFVLLN